MSDFKLISGMQVVERNTAKKGTNQEFRVATFCEEEGWIETECSAKNLDYIKQRELDFILLDKENNL